MPDECDSDCNGNGVLDDIDLTFSGFLYFDNTLMGRTGIERSLPDGTSRLLAVPGPQLNGLAVDPFARRVYWLQYGTPVLLKRAEIDGSNVTTLISNLSIYSSGLAVDRVRDRLLWCQAQAAPAGAIWCSALDGSGASTLISALNDPVRVDVDHHHGKVYWVERGGKRIGRAELDGSNPTYIVTSTALPRDLALDPAGDGLYWTLYYPASNTGRVYRSHLDGSGAAIFYDGGKPGGVTVDQTAGKVYWTSGNYIYRANLDGTQVEVIIPGTTLASPNSIATMDRSSVDCNANGVLDACDILSGVSQDADGNGLPDECVSLGRAVPVARHGAAAFRMTDAAWDSAACSPCAR